MKISGQRRIENELKAMLPFSTGTGRKEIAAYIVQNRIDLHDCFELICADYSTASRFQWLLSDIGLLQPQFLKELLPDLLAFCDDMDNVSKTCFANYWLIAGLPEENESTAMDLCFKWLLSPEINVTIKSRAIRVLFSMLKRYPGIAAELKDSMESQLNKYSTDFDKRINKLLLKIEL